MHFTHQAAIEAEFRGKLNSPRWKPQPHWPQTWRVSGLQCEHAVPPLPGYHLIESFWQWPLCLRPQRLQLRVSAVLAPSFSIQSFCHIQPACLSPNIWHLQNSLASFRHVQLVCFGPHTLSCVYVGVRGRSVSTAPVGTRRHLLCLCRCQTQLLRSLSDTLSGWPPVSQRVTSTHGKVGHVTCLKVFTADGLWNWKPSPSAVFHAILMGQTGVVLSWIYPAFFDKCSLFIRVKFWGIDWRITLSWIFYTAKVKNLESLSMGTLICKSNFNRNAHEKSQGNQFLSIRCKLVQNQKFLSCAKGASSIYRSFQNNLLHFSFLESHSLLVLTNSVGKHWRFSTISCQAFKKRYSSLQLCIPLTDPRDNPPCSCPSY